MAAALVAMAARITAASRTYAQSRERALAIAERADRLRGRMLAARSRDEAAFAAVMGARGEDRQRALREASQAPLDVVCDALDIERLALEAFDLGNDHLASDLASAGEFASAALAASASNVRINHRALKDTALVEAQRAALERCERESARIVSEIRARA
jgi:formiminotetrahydrofolate cyclodeaminase